MAKLLLPLFIAAAKDDEALTDAARLLAKWDMVASPDSAGAALFYTALDNLVRDVLSDELGPDLYKVLVTSHHTWPARVQTVLDKKSIFHNSVNSPQIQETWDVSYRRALAAAYAQLQRELGADTARWRWGDMHTIVNRHPLGTVSQLASDVNIGPFSNGGGPDTVWAAFFSPGSDDFATAADPVFRHVVDMAHPEKSWLALDTGNWGQPLSPHYADLNADWRNNRLIPGLMDRAEIEQNIEGVLVLKPVNLP
jgi:penicillin amidase